MFTRVSWLPVVAMLLFVAACSRAPVAENFTEVPEDDPEMEAAIQSARATLPQFWKSFTSPARGEDDFSLKVAITDDSGTEHFWVTEIERDGNKIIGQINNDPEIVQSVKMGQRIEVPAADISDWMFLRDGKIVGNATLRPLLKRMPAEEATKFRGMLAEP